MKRTDVTFIISNIGKAPAFEWISEEFRDSNFNLNFILLNPSGSKLEDYFIDNNIKYQSIKFRGKKDYPIAFLKVLFALVLSRPRVVHTHLFDASLIGLLASYIARIRKRIYTRHNSSYHHVYFPNAVKYDKLINWLSTDIISISNSVTEVLCIWEGVKVSKVHRINHGFKFEQFLKNGSKYKLEIQNKYGLANRFPIVGVVSRYIDWKGISYIIEAYKNLANIYPNAFLVLANANGPERDVIKSLLNSLPPHSFVEIEFEEKISSLYQCFDAIVHVPIDKYCEAFGQVYIEAMVSKIPGIYTKSGIANEILVHNLNARIVDYKNSKQIYDAIIDTLKNKELTTRIVNQAYNDVINEFELVGMINKMKDLYGK